METYAAENPQAHEAMMAHDLSIVKIPYVAIAGIVLVLLVILLLPKMPDTGREKEKIRLGQLFRYLIGNIRYIGGIVAQTFYVGAQIMCWTFIIHYGMTLLGLSAAEAQNYNILAMVIFLGSRFAGTWLLKYVHSGTLLAVLAAAGFAFTLSAIFLRGVPGLYSLIAVSACMSVMFPTIYGIALGELTPNDAKLGSAGLIFAIVGGALLPRLQGGIIDGDGLQMGSLMLESVRLSFILPVFCFVIIAA